MPDSPPDLDTLVQRLRAVAAEHAEADAVDGEPAAAQPWAPPGSGAGAAPSPASCDIPWAVAARAGGWQPYWLADEDGFVQLAYQRLLGRMPDAGGAAHWIERLRQHAPRAELLAELALSSEALALRPEGARGQRALARVLLLAAQQQRLGVGWFTRGVLRRAERWLTRRAQRSALGLAWAGAREQQAQARQQALQHQMQLAALHAELRLLAEGLERTHQAQDQLQGQLQDTEQAMQQALEQSQTGWRQAVAALHARLQSLNEAPRAAGQPATPRRTADAENAEDAAGTPAASDAHVDTFLAALEAAFRGPRQALHAQLAQDYLTWLAQAREAGGDGPCLDLGCGRGVWLQVLAEAGFANVRGVDLSAAAVAEAQAQGLQAEQADALAWLRAQPGDSALAITAFHLMEHLPFALRLALVGECARVLRPGGLLILETPNPENVWVATHTFHHDPTHSQPLTPDSLEFLVNYCGLQTLAVPRLHPYPAAAALPGDEPVVQRLNHMTCGGQDFAVIAQKPPAGAAQH